MTTEAEEKKLEVAEGRKDGEKDMGEDPKETTEGKPRKDANEEIPAWADKFMDAVTKRLDAMEKKDEKPPTEAADRKDEEKEKEAKEKDVKKAEDEKKEVEAKKDRKDEGDTDKDTDREDRARRDAQVMAENRKLAAKIAEMESRMQAIYKEPSIEDRQAIAEVRSRADSIYQALTGQPASMPIPGESPISYRKRMADGLRRFSDRMKDVRVDALTGEAFAVVEDRIYADAQAATRSDAIVPAGTLRPIVSKDDGHTRTDYIGDSSAWTAPFRAGAVRRLKLQNPKAAH